MKFEQLIDRVINSIFIKKFTWFRGLGPSYKPFLFYLLNKNTEKTNCNEFLFSEGVD